MSIFVRWSLCYILYFLFFAEDQKCRLWSIEDKICFFLRNGRDFVFCDFDSGRAMIEAQLEINMSKSLLFSKVF